MNIIAENLQTIKDQIVAIAKSADRDPKQIQLLAVSKSQPAEKIEQAYVAGQRLFAENYVQEALIKIQQFVELNIEWHFIGTIQSNKTKQIAENFTWVHTISNRKIAQRLNDQRPLNLMPLNVCIEVNISHETSKSGVAPAELQSLAEYCNHLPNLNLRGLMTIPANTDDIQSQRNAFLQLKILLNNLKKHGLSELDTLSMGMSHDFAAAILEGATILRIGTAIFGPRVDKKREE